MPSHRLCPPFYRQTFLIVASLDLLAAAVSTVLYLRTRLTYTAMFQQLHQLDEQLEGSAHGPSHAREQMQPMEAPEQLPLDLQNVLASHPVLLRRGSRDSDSVDLNSPLSGPRGSAESLLGERHKAPARRGSRLNPDATSF